MRLVKQVLVKTFPIFTGYIVLGIGFGILMVKNGFGIGWVLAMSLFIYAGSMQYLGINLLTGGAGILQTAIATLMVNTRHLFYGISMVDKYKDMGKAKPYLAFALTDETYSLVCSEKVPEGVKPAKYYLLISVLNHFYWVLGSCIGALLGNIITFDTTGIDFSMTALFVTVFVQQWIEAKEHFPAITGLAASVVCLFIFGSESFLIPTMLVILVTLLIWRRHTKEEEP